MAKNGKKIEKKNKLEEYKPIRPLDSIDSFFDYAMKTPYKILNNYLADYRMPDTDVIVNGNSYTVKIDVPGVDKKDIKLKVYSNSVEISAERNEEHEEKEKGYYSKERTGMGYYRSIPLPNDVNPKSAKAKMENGTLRIEIEKSEQAKGNEIGID